MQRGRCVVFLIGKAGEDAVLRYTALGTPVLRFSIATDSGLKRQPGEKSPPDWHKVVVVGSKAEDRENLPRKGDTCFIEGTLRTRAVGPSGSGLRVTEVFVDSDGKFTVYHSTATPKATEHQISPDSFAEAERCAGPSTVKSIDVKVFPNPSRKLHDGQSEDEWLSFEGLRLDDLADPFD